MSYEEALKATGLLGYRDKLRLAQTLLQLARKEEEEQHPSKRASIAGTDPELVLYVAERLRKLKPSRKEAVFNSIEAMFQFQGGISDSDKENLFSALVKHRHIVVGANDRIQFPEAATS